MKMVCNQQFYNYFTSRPILLPMQAENEAEHESLYYSPASQETELYSQLRREKIKAIAKDEIE